MDVATIATPNLPELKRLTSEEDPVAAALHLVGAHGCAVLIKGGHEEGDALADALIEDRQYDQLAGPADRHHQHPRHRLHAGQRDRFLPRRGRRAWPTRSRGRASSSASRCTTRPDWGRAPGRSAMAESGSTSAPGRGSTR